MHRSLHYTFVSDFGRPSYLGVFENSRTLKEIILWKAHQNVCKACIIDNSIVWQCTRSLINFSVSEYYQILSYVECLKNSWIFWIILYFLLISNEKNKGKTVLIDLLSYFETLCIIVLMSILCRPYQAYYTSHISL